MSESILELKGRHEVELLNPEVKDKQSYDTVKCTTDALSRTGYKGHGPALTKMCYMAKKKLIIKWKIDKDYLHDAAECGLGQNQRIDKNGLFSTSALRIERTLENDAFQIVSNKTADDPRFEIITAERMPYYVLEEGIEPYDYPYHSIVSIPVSYYENNYFRIIKECKARPGGWQKEAPCIERAKNFIDWRYRPVQFCLVCRRQHGGSHRTYMAKLMNLKRLDVMTFVCWWRDVSFDTSLLYDWGFRSWK